MGDFGYIRCRSASEAQRVAAEIDAARSKVLPRYTAEELERERETLRLRAEFVRVDIRVHDDWSLSGCRRDGPARPR